MIKIENVVTMSREQYQAVIRGMRNPMNSWEKSDSVDCYMQDCDAGCRYEYECERLERDGYFTMGENDFKLCKKLANGGPVHAKYRRMMTVYLDVTAPLYWWKEFDTYKVGTVANSCSTMHKIHAKEFTLEDFSCEKLIDADDEDIEWGDVVSKTTLEVTVNALNFYRRKYLEAKVKPMKDEDARKRLMKKYWWQMIQLLPSSYNQKRTVMLNYEVLVGMYKWRKNHKLDEWVEFCKWIETLPFAELITMEAADIPSEKLPEPVSYNGPKGGYVRTEEEIEREQRKLMEG